MNQTKTNVFDGLLYYLSHIGELEWEKFKDAVKNLTREEPNLKYSTYLTSLARLGHLDYDPMNLDKVVIAPPVLVETAVKDRYVLLGSRSPNFLQEIKECVSKTGGKFYSSSEQYAPTTIILSELTQVSFTDVEGLGIHLSRAFSAKLSDILPIPKRTNFQQVEAPLSDSWNKFNIKTLKYEKDNYFLDDGLYEVPQYGPDVYILKAGSDLRKVPRDWGEWILLSTSGRTTGLISYKKKSQTWCVNRNLLVPLIVGRCATLCSGFPPKLVSGFFCYSDVPVGIAYQLTKSLYQDWEVF
ncbi:hypothetical protein F4X33_15995 [Candidatus Poribacteria bacterium]|nr:hypothetical protein [Candidatus Poribacteria bacterium]